MSGKKTPDSVLVKHQKSRLWKHAQKAKTPKKTKTNLGRRRANRDNDTG